MYDNTYDMIECTFHICMMHISLPTKFFYYNDTHKILNTYHIIRSMIVHNSRVVRIFYGGMQKHISYVRILC